MKKLFVFIFATGLTFYSAHANSGDPEQGTVVDLTVSITDPQSSLGIHLPKGPVQAPYVTLADHTLYIWSQHNGYTLTLYDDNDTVVYQSYVAAGTQMVSLPTTLSGSFTLILSDYTYMYTGTIDL